MLRSINDVIVRVTIAVAALAACTTPAYAQEAPGGFISHAALARLVRVCAPQVSSTTQAAIVAVESGGSAWVLHDDNDDRVYTPSSLPMARAYVEQLIARNHATYGAHDRGVDVGLAQINSSNFSSLGVSPAAMLEPCSNLHASAQIISAAYLRERAVLANDPSWHGDQLALSRALQDYNSGHSTGDDAYVRAIFSTLNSTLVRDVGNGVSVPPLPILPIHFAALATPKPIAAAPIRSSIFYHHENGVSPKPVATQAAAPVASPSNTGSMFVHTANAPIGADAAPH